MSIETRKDAKMLRKNFRIGLLLGVCLVMATVLLPKSAIGTVCMTKFKCRTSGGCPAKTVKLDDSGKPIGCTYWPVVPSCTGTCTSCSGSGNSYMCEYTSNTADTCNRYESATVNCGTEGYSDCYYPMGEPSGTCGCYVVGSWSQTACSLKQCTTS